jgi:hypothetical protein
MPLSQTETESYIYQRLMVAGSQGSITFSKSAFNEIYKFSKGTPRLINLLCDRALLGGFVEQNFHIDKEIIKKAKNSLLGEEKTPKPFYAYALPEKLIPLRIALWAISIFLLMSLIFMSQSYLSIFQNAKNLIWNGIPKAYSQIFGEPSPSHSTIRLNKEQVQKFTENTSTKDLEIESQEVSK